MELLDTINLENANPSELDGFSLRKAARAVVFDSEGNIALMSVTIDGYHKLPGGGVEEGEEIKDALFRECKEEIGCDIEIVSELGLVVEYRKKDKLIGQSYCYVAKITGEKGTPSFTDSELSKGFAIEWMPLEKAVALIESESPEGYKAKYIVQRDTAFLRAAKKLV